MKRKFEPPFQPQAGGGGAEMNRLRDERTQRLEQQRSQFLAMLESPALQVPLSAEQQQIIDLILRGENVFFTGVCRCALFLLLF
jgi:hypothetical protein